MCAQSEMVETAFDGQAFQFEHSVQDRKHMIICNYSGKLE